MFDFVNIVGLVMDSCNAPDCLIPLKNGDILQSSNILLNIWVLCQCSLQYVLLIDEFSRVITPLLAVFKLVLFMMVPRDLSVHYYAFHAFQRVHFFFTMIVITSLQCTLIQLICVLVYYVFLFYSFRCPADSDDHWRRFYSGIGTSTQCGSAVTVLARKYPFLPNFCICLAFLVQVKAKFIYSGHQIADWLLITLQPHYNAHSGKRNERYNEMHFLNDVNAQ